jgi:hypothetical protein
MLQFVEFGFTCSFEGPSPEININIGAGDVDLYCDLDVIKIWINEHYARGFKLKENVPSVKITFNALSNEGKPNIFSATASNKKFNIDAFFDVMKNSILTESTQVGNEDLLIYACHPDDREYNEAIKAMSMHIYLNDMRLGLNHKIKNEMGEHLDEINILRENAEAFLLQEHELLIKGLNNAVLFQNELSINIQENQSEDILNKYVEMTSLLFPKVSLLGIKKVLLHTAWIANHSDMTNMRDFVMAQLIFRFVMFSDILINKHQDLFDEADDHELDDDEEYISFLRNEDLQFKLELFQKHQTRELSRTSGDLLTLYDLNFINIGLTETLVQKLASKESYTMM